MKHRSSWWKTLIGIILTLIMLFPVYWDDQHIIHATSLHPFR